MGGGGGGIAQMRKREHNHLSAQLAAYICSPTTWCMYTSLSLSLSQHY